MRSVIVIFLGLALYGTACLANEAPAPVVTDAALAKVATDSVLNQLDTNAKTAQFRNVRVHTWRHRHTVYLPVEGQKEGYRAVCGEVRYRDAKGLMTDYVRFIYISEDSTIGVTSQDWSDSCVE
jgi:hypothetical protein